MVINENLINQLKSLSKYDKLTVINILLNPEGALQKKHNITELAGLGKEIWKDIDAQKYVDEERANWS